MRISDWSSDVCSSDLSRGIPMLDQQLLPFDRLGGRSGRPVSRRRREMAMRFDESPHLLAEDIVFGPVIKIHNASNFHAGGKQEGGSPHRSVRTPLPPEDRAPGARDRNQSGAWPCARPLPIPPPPPRREFRRQKPGGGLGG